MRPHDPLSSYERISALLCPSLPSPFVSVRFGANPQLVHSPLRSPLTCAAFRIHLIAGRSTSTPCQFVTHRINTVPFPLAASPVLPVVPYLRIVGHVVSPRFRLLPTRMRPVPRARQRRSWREAGARIVRTGHHRGA